MKITIELDTITDDLADMIAIFDALGNRESSASIPVTVHDRLAAPPPPASESMIGVEAARVADTVPPPPPSAFDQVAPPPPAAAAPSGPLDSKGTPWDSRIHADSKGVNADGQFKRRKGVDVATYDRIAAELRAGRATVPNGGTPASTESPAGDATAVVDAPPPPPPPVADTVPPPPPPPAAPAGITAQAILADMGRRGLTFEQNGELAKAVGLAGVQDILSATPEKLQALADMLVLVHGPAGA